MRQERRQPGREVGVSCNDCSSVRAVPDDVQGGYRACPGCVIEATATTVYVDTEDADPDT